MSAAAYNRGSRLVSREADGMPGDRLWVRETWYDDNGLRDPDDHSTELIEYRADHDCRSWEAGCPCCDENGRSCWRPSIFLPRWASRLTLEVTALRVERLQSISEDDAKAEGVEAAPFCKAGRPQGLEHVESFECLWNRINGKRASWKLNPWVWVVSFQRIEQPAVAA